MHRRVHLAAALGLVALIYAIGDTLAAFLNPFTPTHAPSVWRWLMPGLNHSWFMGCGGILPGVVLILVLAFCPWIIGRSPASTQRRQRMIDDGSAVTFIGIIILAALAVFSTRLFAVAAGAWALVFGPI
jgi:hypothetical protein